MLDQLPLVAALASGHVILSIDADLLSGHLFVTTGTGRIVAVPLTAASELLALESIPTIVGGLVPGSPGDADFSGVAVGS